MGLGMVVLAFTAVYRSAASAGRDDQIPAPATTDLPQGDGDALRGPAPAPPPTTSPHPAP